MVIMLAARRKGRWAATAAFLGAAGYSCLIPAQMVGNWCRSFLSTGEKGRSRPTLSLERKRRVGSTRPSGRLGEEVRSRGNLEEKRNPDTELQGLRPNNP
ncbi:hypothetical protein K456DRAFT_277125 [Colletotrichum gloeosporioides 23]|nr:hypothetical protein K456DRAFT_277125 [Colletotrichum gloeosporioides 23]